MKIKVQLFVGGKVFDEMVGREIIKMPGKPPSKEPNSKSGSVAAVEMAKAPPQLSTTSLRLQ